MLRRSFRRRGFSLIEAAIVLGIVGLVIGGIWVAAAAVMNRNRINDAITLVMLAHEEAVQLKKNAGGVDQLAPILAIQPLPGNYSLSGAYLTNGQQWFSGILVTTAADPRLTGIFLVNAPSASLALGETKPDLCLELSKKLLGVDLGSSGTLTWSDPTHGIASWTPSNAKPDMTTLTTYCQTTSRITFTWYL